MPKSPENPGTRIDPSSLPALSWDATIPTEPFFPSDLCLIHLLLMTNFSRWLDSDRFLDDLDCRARVDAARRVNVPQSRARRERLGSRLVVRLEAVRSLPAFVPLLEGPVPGDHAVAL